MSLMSLMSFVLYADYIISYNTHNVIDILFNRRNIQLEKLYNWLCLNKLSLSIDK